MLSKRSQTANVSTLPEAKRRSSFVIWKWSNNRMQRSRASRFLNVASMQHARPADTERYTWSKMSVVEIRRAKPRPHNLDQCIYKSNAEERCAGSVVGRSDSAADVLPHA